jgi:hypothetical protein
MKIGPGWFLTLHPLVQSVAVICLGAFLIAVVFNKEASANIVNLLPYLLYLIGNGRTEIKSSPKE